ncbi:MAG: hypothetical protein IPM21_13400 [Acidobacteria bacterium]|nr:hypothetical protein [Acidobacteriota bacterium]
MAKWNDTDEPIAYLITFRTYGTWLPGDERGSIDKYHNRFEGPRSVASSRRESIQHSRLKSEPFLLSARARSIVEMAIREVSEFRKWPLNALNVRTNHVHVVPGAVAPSAKMLGDFKRYATRRLREAELWTFEHSPWVDKGSRRFLWTDEHVEAAIEYVVNGQGGELPDFD